MQRCGRVEHPLSFPVCSYGDLKGGSEETVYGGWYGYIDTIYTDLADLHETQQDSSGAINLCVLCTCLQAKSLAVALQVSYLETSRLLQD